jgi:transposase
MPRVQVVPPVRNRLNRLRSGVPLGNLSPSQRIAVKNARTDVRVLMLAEKGSRTMIALSQEDRRKVEAFIRRGKANARNITRAHVLLKSTEGWSIERIAETYGVSQATVSNVRARFRAGGVERVLKDKVQQKRRRVLAGADEAVLVAVACSPVPEGHDHWTVRMLQAKLVEMGVVESIGRGTIHDRLKKMNSSRGSGNTGVSRKR